MAHSEIAEVVFIRGADDNIAKRMRNHAETSLLRRLETNPDASRERVQGFETSDTLSCQHVANRVAFSNAMTAGAK